MAMSWNACSSINWDTSVHLQPQRSSNIYIYIYIYIWYKYIYIYIHVYISISLSLSIYIYIYVVARQKIEKSFATFCNYFSGILNLYVGVAAHFFHCILTGLFLACWCVSWWTLLWLTKVRAVSGVGWQGMVWTTTMEPEMWFWYILAYFDDVWMIWMLDLFYLIYIYIYIICICIYVYIIIYIYIFWYAIIFSVCKHSCSKTLCHIHINMTSSQRWFKKNLA